MEQGEKFSRAAFTKAQKRRKVTGVLRSFVLPQQLRHEALNLVFGVRAYFFSSTRIIMFMKFLMRLCILFKTPAFTKPPPIITMFNHVMTDLIRYKNRLDTESESE